MKVCKRYKNSRKSLEFFVIEYMTGTYSRIDDDHLDQFVREASSTGKSKHCSQANKGISQK